MANLIQIKRSLNTAAPTSLANGELAFSANGNVLFIGSNGAVEAIGGLRSPGILAANQALVANSSSAIDKVIVANAVITSLYANGSSGSAGQVLVTDGSSVYWGTGTSGNNTEIQFNDSGVANGSAGFTFNKTSNTLSVGNNIVISGNVTSTNTTTGSLTVSGGVGVNGRINTTDLAAGNTSVYSTLTGNSLTTVDVFATGTVNALALSGNGALITSVDAATVGGNTASDLRTYTDNAANAAYSNAVSYAASNTYVNNTFVTIANSIMTGFANAENLEVSGNTVLGSNSSDVVAFNATVNTNVIPTANATYLMGNNTLRWLEVNAANVHAVEGYFEGKVEIGGDLIVSGNVVTTNVTSVIISDPLIYLAGNNYTSDLVDIGFVGNYHQGGTNKHTGVFRHAATDQYYIFKGLTQELDDVLVVNIADPTFALADVNAYLLSGGLVSNATHVAITANATLDVAIVANTLSIATPLAATSGGIGHSSYTAGDILVASNTTYLSKLGLGSDGYVLQSNGTSLVYGTLDGGTF